MMLLTPFWLLLVIPLVTVGIVWKLPARALNRMRVVVVLLVLLGMSRPVARLPDRHGSVIVVADRSRSMTHEHLKQQEEVIELLCDSMKGGNKLGVIAFGASSVVARPPQGGAFPGFMHEIDGDQSNLGEALALAMSMIPSSESSRILVLSDGLWTGRDPAVFGARAASRGVPIDYRRLQRTATADLAIRGIASPLRVKPADSFLVTASLDVPAPCEVHYKLRRGKHVLAAGVRNMTSGRNRLVFRDTAPEPGVLAYQLVIGSAEDDPVPENNRARFLLKVEGERPLLCVTPSGGESGLVQLLGEGGVNVVEHNAGNLAWSLPELAKWSAVLVENVSAGDIGLRGMKNLAEWVKSTGSGLMMTGGKNGFGPGGYFRSPLDEIMPVSMELRSEHRKFALAIVVAMDRSGSMAASAGSGKTKMDLANIGAVQVLDMLSDNDEIGVVAVDSSSHVVVDLGTVERNRAERGKILRIQSMGGGIFVYEALKKASGMLLESDVGTRHIILFADAADAEQPGEYVELLKKCSGANMTVSVVGLGTERDVDAEFLKDVAERGGGRCYFTDSASEIPRLFAQDTFCVTRSAFVDEVTPVGFTPGISMLSMKAPGDPPPVGGYNLCYLKPDANLAMVTKDEYTAPILSSWHAGNGRVLCYAAEADGEYAGPIAGWSDIAALFCTMSRWVQGADSELPDGAVVRESIEGGVYRVELHLDPERETESFVTTPEVVLLRGVAGSPPETETVSMRWETADMLVAETLLLGEQTVVPTLLLNDRRFSLSPACLPYSPEFRPEESAERGQAALATLASTTGGKQCSDLSSVWKEMPRMRRYIDLSPWCYILAVIVFTMEVLERRTGLVSMVVRRGLGTRVGLPAMFARTSDESEQLDTSGKTLSAPGKKETNKEPGRKSMEPEKPDAESGESMIDAMKLARRKSRQRLRR